MTSEEPDLVPLKPYERTQNGITSKPKTGNRFPTLLIVAGALIAGALWMLAVYSVSDEDSVPPEEDIVVADGQAGSGDSGADTPATPKSATPDVPETTGPGPWEKANLAEQRQAALDVIQNLRQQKEKLDAMSPTLWAGDQLQMLNTYIEEGDKAPKLWEWCEKESKPYFEKQAHL